MSFSQKTIAKIIIIGKNNVCRKISEKNSLNHKNKYRKSIRKALIAKINVAK